jgi:hypothetical protein
MAPTKKAVTAARRTPVPMVPAPHSDRLKWVGDGAATFEELAAMLRAEAGRFEDLAKRGAKLDEPVDEGWVHYTIPGHEVRAGLDDELCPLCFAAEGEPRAASPEGTRSAGPAPRPRGGSSRRRR